MECSVQNCKSESVRKCGVCKKNFCAIHWEDHKETERINAILMDNAAKFRRDINPDKR